MRLAIIGGTGVQGANLLASPHSLVVNTPYGPTFLLQSGEADQATYFLLRHGEGHSIPPHRINYRANIWALHQLGVDGVIATSAVGSLRSELQPGQLLLIDTFLDFTSGRAATFFDGADGVVRHTDVTYPYCATLRSTLAAIAKKQGVNINSSGCYVCTNGPRYETAAEVRAYGMLGGDVVGMTGVPEVVLARELGLCYASIALVTNLGAGLSGDKLTHEAVVNVMQAGGATITKLLQETLQQAPAIKCGAC